MQRPQQRIILWFIPDVALTMHPVEVGIGTKKEKRHSTGQAPFCSVCRRLNLRGEIEAELDVTLVDCTEDGLGARVENDVA